MVEREVGLRIKGLRAEAGISQEQLAFEIGMARSYLAEVETGKRNVSIRNLEKIAAGLGVSLSQLFEPFANVPDIHELSPDEPSQARGEERRRQRAGYS